jgi:hypothetical protein
MNASVVSWLEESKQIVAKNWPEEDAAKRTTSLTTLLDIVLGTGHIVGTVGVSTDGYYVQFWTSHGPTVLIGQVTDAPYKWVSENISEIYFGDNPESMAALRNQLAGFAELSKEKESQYLAKMAASGEIYKF